MLPSMAAADALEELRQQTLEVVKTHGLRREDVAFELSSGETSFDYIDGKLAVATGARLELVSRAILALVEQQGMTFETVGGLTMGSDALAHGVSIAGGKDWFTVRKERKEHGRRAMVEGAKVLGRRALLLDDVVTTGASIARALDAVEEAGGTVVFATALVDRSGKTETLLGDRGVPFVPLLTWIDLGIDPVGRVPA
jgi:orotate phosphoribosyltransferase